MGSARLYIYLVLIMSVLPSALDVIISGLACRASHVIKSLALDLGIRSIRGPGMITLLTRMRTKMYDNIADARSLLRNSAENARLMTVDANINIRIATFARTRFPGKSL